MVLKRKRSDSEISTSSSLLSSPLSQSNYIPLDNYTTPQSAIATPSLFSSRTRKRHRDNRPSEVDVHRMPFLSTSSESPLIVPSTEHTLSLLFSAQQTPHPQSFNPPSAFPSQQTPIASIPSSSQSTQQSSLHSFWAIPSARHSSPSSNSSTSNNTPSTSPPHSSFFRSSNCEDCDAPLNVGDGGDSMDVDMMMDIDMDSTNYGCSSCGKQVCHGCAVSNLGEDRRCLVCTKPKKRWVGGLGWVDAD